MAGIRFSKFFFIICIIAFGSCDQKGNSSKNSIAENSTPIKEEQWSVRMANSIMKRNTSAFQIDQKKEPKWDYVHGLVLLAFQQLSDKTGDEKYYDYGKTYVDTLVQSDGSITRYKFEDYNIDMINAGKLLFDIYDKTEDAKYLKAMQLLRRQLEEAPRTSQGGFWHKKRYPDQMWLDGLYMGAPFYAQYTSKFENGKKLDDVAKQFELIEEHAKDTATGLLYHGWDESKEQKWADSQTGTSPNFWSRSLGWYAMALVDVLEYFPEDHPKHPELVDYLNQLAVAVEKVQDESGLWYQVPNMGEREGNYLEASGSAMLAYALAKGANNGYLPDHYLNVANKAFDGLVEKLIVVNDDGTITITQACAVAGLGGDPYRDGSYEYYVNERKQDNDPKATGPFILAALQLNR
ncbi:MAG: glycosyl hydrolase family 88 [Cytophagaceae bacterium]|nr:glycosyl hydrolase family 88 [Cytophagaceae bacterium]|tara:strand:+ start:312 stop:1532 length:1221 start_codon:yes stop_codon:yes gene_type:complete